MCGRLLLADAASLSQEADAAQRRGDRAEQKAVTLRSQDVTRSRVRRHGLQLMRSRVRQHGLQRKEAEQSRSRAA